MENLYSNVPVILVLLFTTITFLQSGFDKLTDWSGNIAWLKGHFEKTFLSGIVPLMVATILLMELIVGVLAIAGLYSIIVDKNTVLAFWSLVLGEVTLLMLLFGQRVAKDYAGAFTITGYFMVILFGIFLISQ